MSANQQPAQADESLITLFYFITPLFVLISQVPIGWIAWSYSYGKNIWTYNLSMDFTYSSIVLISNLLLAFFLALLTYRIHLRSFERIYAYITVGIITTLHLLPKLITFAVNTVPYN